MPLFQYRATDLSGKEVRGSIEAATPDAAREALENIHLSGISIQEASRARNASSEETGSTPQELLSAFAFEGTDTSGETRRGTVQAGSKYSAFEKLREAQGLTLTMLSPLGVTPKYRDPDLERWQGQERQSLSSPMQAPTISVSPLQFSAPTRAAASFSRTASPPSVPSPIPSRKSIGFSGVSEEAVPLQKAEAPRPVVQGEAEYHPLTATLRLYGGWLLAWYALFVALGYYTHTRTLSWTIPFVEAFYLSPLIFSFTVAIFLFLLLSALHRWMRGGLIAGIVLGIVGVLVFLAVRLSI